MSIDARVDYVFCNENGGGKLVLLNRPARPGRADGIAGQAELAFKSAPEEITALNGLDIWGGSEEIILGNTRIATRVGATEIEFCNREIFTAAVERYRREWKHYTPA